MSGRYENDIDNLQEAFTREGLFDEHISARLEGSTHIIIAVLSSQKDNRRCGQVLVFLERLADVIAVHVGHHDVQQDNIRQEIAGYITGFHRRVFDDDPIASLTEEGLNYFRDLRFIIYNQYFGC